jgi:hypothetical protein
VEAAAGLRGRIVRGESGAPPPRLPPVPALAEQRVRNERLRQQIEAAAALVPRAQRTRVLGPLSLKARDDQVKSAVGVLFLAKMLDDFGWSVDFEPVVGTQTPNLLIRRGATEYIVEVRRVVGRAAEDTQAHKLVQRALKHIRTATPLHITAMQVDGSASLRPFVQHVERMLATHPLPAGSQHFTSTGVTIVFEVGDHGADKPIFPAVFSWPTRVLHGNDADRAEAAINDKLRTYKQPIVVALDLDGVLGSFDDVIEAFYGERKMIVPVQMDGNSPPEEARLGPMQDGMLVGRDRNAERARERLIALLPFSWGMTSEANGFDIYARVLANPAFEPAQTFREFAPIPRFIVDSRPDDHTVMMRWEPPLNPSGWRHILRGRDCLIRRFARVLRRWLSSLCRFCRAD